jgi:HlyD family secretion protein
MATTDSEQIVRPRRERNRNLRQPTVPKSLVEFQPDAVEIEKRSVPGGARWTLYTIIALLIAAVIWACWAKVDRIVVAQGTLITREPPVVIQPLASAVIDEIRVKFGDIVRRGDILATLDPTFSEADVAKLQLREDGLNAAIARLTSERDQVEFRAPAGTVSEAWNLELKVNQDRQKEFDAKMATFVAEREKFKVQQQNNLSEIKSLEERVEILKQHYDLVNTLVDKRSESLLELWRARIEKLDAERSLEKANSDREQLIRDIELNNKQELQFVTEWRSKISTDLLVAHRERDEVTEELTKARRMEELVVLQVPPELPSDQYVVLEIAERSPGSAPKPGESLFKLVPVNAALEAEVEIQARDIGLIKAENTARLKLDAFPYQKHGVVSGVISTISEGSFQKGEPPTTQTMYRARIQLGSTDQLKNLPSQHRLLPGMTVVAEIRVGDRRVIEYFLYPLLRSLDSSIREP